MGIYIDFAPQQGWDIRHQLGSGPTWATFWEGVGDRGDRVGNRYFCENRSPFKYRSHPQRRWKLFMTKNNSNLTTQSTVHLYEIIQKLPNPHGKYSDKIWKPRGKYSDKSVVTCPNTLKGVSGNQWILVRVLTSGFWKFYYIVIIFTPLDRRRKSGYRTDLVQKAQRRPGKTGRPRSPLTTGAKATG